MGDGITLCSSVGWRSISWKGTLQKKDFWDSKSAMSQQWTPAAQKANSILGDARKSIALQIKEDDPSPLFSPGETTSEVLCPAFDFPQERHGYTGEGPRP